LLIAIKKNYLKCHNTCKDVVRSPAWHHLFVHVDWERTGPDCKISKLKKKKHHKSTHSSCHVFLSKVCCTGGRLEQQGWWKVRN